MKNNTLNTRRDFVRKLGIGSVFAALGTSPVIISCAGSEPKSDIKKEREKGRNRGGER